MMTRDNKGKFLPGVSGNPRGRATKSRELKYVEQLQKRLTPEVYRDILDVLIRGAKRGDTKMIQILLDYAIGKPVQRTEISGMDGEPVGIIWDIRPPTPQSQS